FRDLASRVCESLVGDFPRAADSGHSKKIDKGGSPPASIFSNHRHGGAADPGDRDDARPVTSALTERMRFAEFEERADWFVVAFPEYLAEHPGLVVECTAQLCDIAL